MTGWNYETAVGKLRKLTLMLDSWNVKAECEMECFGTLDIKIRV